MDGWPAALEARAARRETPCGDGALVWRTWGPADGPPVLLLHGGSGCWAHWARNVDALVAAGWRVLVPDLPGFGDSAPPPDGHDADVLPAWLERGLARLVGDRALPVVGFSFGGLVAGLWASACPGRFQRLVLVGAPALSTERLAPLDLRDWRRGADPAAQRALHRHNLRQLMLAQDASVDEAAVAIHAHGVARDRLRRRRLMLTDALARLLPGLPMPVAGVWGEHDVLYATRRPLVARVLGGAQRFEGVDWIAGAGHWVAYERADAFNAALLARLAG